MNGGTLDLATGDARLYSDTYRTTTLTIQTGGTLRAARLSHGFANNLGQLTNNCPNSVINGGTLDLVGIADTSARGWTIGTNGATIRSAGATAQVWQPSNEAWTQIDLNNGATLTFDVGGTFQLKSTIMDYTGTPGGAGGVSTSNGGVIKTGAGTLTMSALTLTAAAGSHRYTGTTSIQQGTLVLDVSLGTSPVVVSDSATFAIGGGIATVGTGGLTLGATSTLTLQVDTTSVTADRINVAGNVALNGATLNLSTLGASTLTAGTKFTLISYSGSLSGEFSGLLEGSNISIGANTFKLRYADTNAVTLEVVSSGYSGWASANGANGQNPDQDHDNDGMPNGLEYFMGETGSSFTANPSVVNGKVIWPKDPAANATYVVQISSNLKDEVTSGDGGWSNTTSGVVDTGTAVEFTLPNGDPRRFARIQVIVP